MNSARPPLPRRLLLAFSMPAVMLGFMHAPESVVQGIYARHVAELALAMLITRILDALTYPLIGYLSDLTASRSGSRKPWLAAGTAATVLGLFFLYRPPLHAGAWYFGVWFMVAYAGWKLTEIPYSAWSFELSSDYRQRVQIQVWRGMGMLLGGLLFYAMPYLARALGLSPGTSFDLPSLSLTALVMAVLVPALNAWCLLGVPAAGVAEPRPGSPAAASVRELWVSIADNAPLLRLLAAFIPVSVCAGMANGVTYLFVDAYLREGAHLPALLILSVPLTLLGLPFWGWLCKRYERHRVWAVSLLAGAVPCAAQAWVHPGGHAFAAVMCLFPLTLFALAAVSVAVPAMTGDIVDYGKARFGVDRAGLYAALFAFLNKSLAGVSAALGLLIVGWFGFDATAATHGARGVAGLKLVAVGIPTLSMLVAAATIWNFPLDRARLAALERLAAAGGGPPG